LLPILGYRLRTTDSINNFVLCFCNPFTDFDDIELPSSITVPEISNNTGFYVTGEDGLVTLSQQHFAELQWKIQHVALQVTHILSAFVSTMQACTNFM
jgi:hypothetical protein